jgi:hypothetical protein
VKAVIERLLSELALRRIFGRAQKEGLGKLPGSFEQRRPERRAAAPMRRERTPPGAVVELPDHSCGLERSSDAASIEQVEQLVAQLPPLPRVSLRR